MNINHSEYTIAEMAEQFKRKDLVINRQYQRGGGLWPTSAQSYFIDTIIQGYPFPKLYFYQVFDKARKKPIVEVVDGQQRLLTIIDFINDKVKLNKASSTHAGLVFSDLTEQEREDFIMYRVPVDVILAAQRPELLEMFRRMNAYTAPLNSAEKRHAKYQGKFKWFAVELSDVIGTILEEWSILTTKQIVRMGDTELIADLVLVLENGIGTKSDSEINKLYERYEDNFPKEKDYFDFISGFFQTLSQDFTELRGTLLMKPYAIHSLFAAYAHIKRGIPHGEDDIGFPSRQKEIKKDRAAIAELLELSDAHELKDVTGKYKDYVASALNTTTKAAQRRTRTRIVSSILDPK